MIYLDHAATSPLAPEVLVAMQPFLTDVFANPASDHAPGRRAKKAVENARAQVAALINATAEEIIWTSGATEANNLAIKGAIEFRGLDNAHIVTSKTEHKCVLDTCRYLESQYGARGLRVTYLKPGVDGCVTAEQVMAALTPQTVLVSLMWVSNELGTINEVEKLALLLRERGVLLHVDAVQAAGKLAIDLATTPIDLLSLSAHKIYGPKGIGALFVRKRPRARVAPQLHGGGHEQGMRSGTLAPHQCVGMGAAFALAASCLADDAAHIGALRDRLWMRLQALPRIYRNGTGAVAPHILNVSFEGVEGEALRALLPQLAVSSGAACSSVTREPSYVLRALGRDDALANASLRFSLGRGSTAVEIDSAAQQIIDAVLWLRTMSGEVSQPGITTAPDNSYDYPQPIWTHFLQAASLSGGFDEGTPNVQTLRVENRASASWLALHLRMAEGQVAAARFTAFGCPVGIAVGHWLAAWAVGKTSAALHALDMAELRRALEIPADKLHCALMAEDALRQLPRTP